MEKYREYKQKILAEANFMVENNSTVRETAKIFGISKSTVYVHMTDKLPEFDTVLHEKIKKVLANNKAERHIRGGNATRRKYQNKKLEKI